MEKKKILIVDDEKLIREIICDYLEDSYEMVRAENGAEALAMENLSSFDVVISDINMPGIPGYQLLEKIKKMHPHIKVVLITAYNVDDYINMAKEHGISNIISKTVPFNFKELEALISGLISENIFGLEKYMYDENEVFYDTIIKSSDEAKFVREDILKKLEANIKDTGELKLVLDEIVTNALYHSPQDKDGNEIYPEFSKIDLKESEYIEVKGIIDKEKYGISITDNQGNLTKETILYKIDRHLKGEGILDDDGRGIFMSRIFSDRFVININPKVKTEILIINYKNKIYKGFKPLIINEL